MSLPPQIAQMLDRAPHAGRQSRGSPGVRRKVTVGLQTGAIAVPGKLQRHLSHLWVTAQTSFITLEALRQRGQQLWTHPRRPQNDRN